jgi:hypothetical protein
MILKRVALLTLCLVVGWAVAAQTAFSKTYSLSSGSGAQLHIGNGLALPIQQAAGGGVGTGTVFMPLLIPPAPGATVMQTTNMASKMKINIPAGALSKPAAQTTVGVKFSNPVVYAVGTNLKYTWPAANAVLSQNARTGAVTTTFIPGPTGQSMRYSNALSSKFGGPAQFKLSSGGAGGLIAAPVTVYIAAFGGVPPCTHPTFGGANIANNNACKARLAHAKPSLAKNATSANTGLQAVGGPAGTLIKTPGGTVGASGVYNLKVGGATPGPSGTIISAKVTAAMGVGGINNKATSRGYPWTTGKVTIKATKAGGTGETFTLTGMDSRTSMGAGTIQLVAGSVSQRVTSMDNANRGWLRLVMAPAPGVAALSNTMRAAASGLMLLVFGYAIHRFYRR